MNFVPAVKNDSTSLMGADNSVLAQDKEIIVTRNTSRPGRGSRRSDNDGDISAEGLHKAFVGAQASAMRELIQEVAGQKNRGFKQIYKNGWERILALAAGQQSTVPLMLYITLCKFSGSTSAVVASNEVLGKLLGKSAKTIQRASKHLVDIDAVRRFRVDAGGAYCYALRPEEIWGGFAADRERAPFYTLHLVSFKGQDEAVKLTIPTIAMPRTSPATTTDAEAAAALGLDTSDLVRIAATVSGQTVGMMVGVPSVPPGALDLAG